MHINKLWIISCLQILWSHLTKEKKYLRSLSIPLNSNDIITNMNTLYKYIILYIIIILQRLYKLLYYTKIQRWWTYCLISLYKFQINKVIIIVKYLWQPVHWQYVEPHRSFSHLWTFLWQILEHPKEMEQDHLQENQQSALLLHNNYSTNYHH